ncbi:hypothetical protein DFS34DRAFT_1330 [Phlyctochytrium arcticum]|nr:hypothetical protein DFS34DRAFT_1330 [Phlyctochytrium arcticum]
MSRVDHKGNATADFGFQQDPPTLGNQFDEDVALQGILAHYLPSSVYANVESDIRQFGGRVVSDIQDMGDNAEANPPTLTQYDHWCRRVDTITTAEGWRTMKGVSAQEGLVAIAFERKFEHHSRIYQFAKLYLAAPAMAMFGCPLAMTDGAARLIELYGSPSMKERAYRKLTSRDPAQFWTSGQWMTERPGGSDVGDTETIAERENGSNDWRVSGFKWFSSATDCDMTFLLARTKDAQGRVQTSSKGLSLFYAQLRDEKGKLDGIRVHRLKNKLGTKALPTAELVLDGLPAVMVGAENRGVATITVILNITRIHSAMSTAANLQRSLAIAKSYAQKRTVFGKRLVEQPLHLRTLANLDLTMRACTHFLFFAVKLLGEAEASPNEQARQRAATLLRVTTPLLKMWVCYEGTRGILEAMEACGGQGYMEETGIARHLRDALVNSIWEGTTNVQALDLLRTVQNLFPTYQETITSLLASNSFTELSAARTVIQSALHEINTKIRRNQVDKAGDVQSSARLLGFAMARTLIAAILVDHARVMLDMNHVDARASLIAAQRWAGDDVSTLVGLLNSEKSNQMQDDAALLFPSSIRPEKARL